MTPLAIGERLSGELPGARLVIYPSCGHFPMLEHARQSTAELARFLAEASPAASIAQTSGGEAAPQAPRAADAEPTVAPSGVTP